MRILIHGINFSPELTGIGRYTGEMAEWLAMSGHELRVVTAPPYYPQWRVGGGYHSWRYRRESIAGVDVWRCPLWIPAHPSGFTRLLHLASFAISSMPVMLSQIFWRPDVVVVVEPPLFCAPAAWLLARLSRAKAWLHVQDFEVDAAFGLGILRVAWMKRLVLWLESALMRRFDRVSTISDSMQNLLHQKGVSRQRTALLPNWVDTGLIFFDAEAAERFRRDNGVKAADQLILYAGNMGEKQGLEFVLDAAASLQDVTGLRFILCGEGAARARLESEGAARRLANVHFLPLQPADQLAAMLSAADVHLVVQRRGAADLVMPSKLAAILAVGGTAVITAAENTELGRLEHRYPGIAILCPPENVEALGACIKNAISDKARLRGNNNVAMRYAQNELDKHVVLDKLNSILARR